MNRWFRYVKVTPLPTKRRPLIYRASYKKVSAYGRTPQQAVDKVVRKYKDSRLTPGNILNAVASSFLPL